MGVAGVLMLGSIFFFFKSVVSFIMFFIWKIKVNTTGVVRELKTREIKHTGGSKKIDGMKYIYIVDVCVNVANHSVELIEKVSGENPSALEIGETIPVFVDLRRSKARNAKSMKSDLWRNPLFFSICTILYFVCLLIAVYLL